MKLKYIDVNRKVVKTADRVVGFDASDMPSPGVGFEQFFERLNGGTNRPISHDAFDAEVLKMYERKP